MVIDKQIHRNELKLRLLMSNKCNKNCAFCLNDFQNKPTMSNQLFLDTELARMAILNYSRLFKNVFPLQVYFSGGEPTLHRNLIYLMEFAKNNNCKVVLNTNGTFPKHMESSLIQASDEIHFGTYEIDSKHAEKVLRMKGNIQCVFSEKYPYVNEEFVKFYLNYGLKIKIFDNFYENNYNSYITFAENMYSKYGDNISFRYTGVQENRGSGCKNCTNKCITLKAAWLFPDGGTTPCPQQKYTKVYPKNDEEWLLYFNEVNNFHSVN